MLILRFGPSVHSQVAGYFLFAISAHALIPSVADFYIDLVLERDRVFMNGLRLAVLHTTWFAGAWIAGFVVEKWGYDYFFLLPAAVCAAAVAYVLFFLRRVKTTTQKALESIMENRV